MRGIPSNVVVLGGVCGALGIPQFGSHAADPTLVGSHAPDPKHRIPRFRPHARGIPGSGS